MSGPHAGTTRGEGEGAPHHLWSTRGLETSMPLRGQWGHGGLGWVTVGSGAVVWAVVPPSLPQDHPGLCL